MIYKLKKKKDKWDFYCVLISSIRTSVSLSSVIRFLGKYHFKEFNHFYDFWAQQSWYEACGNFFGFAGKQPLFPNVSHPGFNVKYIWACIYLLFLKINLKINFSLV